MGLRDDVRQRRQEKIKSLLSRYESEHTELGGGERQAIMESLASETERSRDSSIKRDSGEPGHITFHESEALFNGREDAAQNRSRRAHTDDPERAWKANPNPWAAWEDRRNNDSAPRSYVTSQHTDDFKPPGNGWRSLRRGFAWKFAISAVLFGGIWAMYESDHPWAAKGQAFVSETMSTEMDFAAVAGWYRDVFAGSPSFIPIFNGREEGSAMVNGEPRGSVVAPLEDAAIVRTFAELLNGVELAGEPNSAVVAAETGRVIQVSEQKDSVLIQHAGDRISIYSKLASASVAVNDWVEAGQPIGTLAAAASDGAPSLLYFGIKQNNRYLDPLDVIPLD